MEIRAASARSFEDAVRAAVERAKTAVENVNCVWVLEQKANVSKGKIVEYAVVVRVAADAKVSIDEDQKVVEFDSGAEITFGYSRGEVMGQSIEILIPERYRSHHARDVRGFADSPTPTRMMGERERIVGLRKDGTEFPAVASISKDVEGGRRRYSVLLREITD